ncbi:MAG: efflux RND transporter periplasmic adaptor subunit [Limnohabitans sp.]|nr:efflux RND transporter periplasmic adaptor subunit [Limnohabitans sp.]
MNRPTLMLGLAGMALMLTTLMLVWWWPGPVVTTSEVVRRDMMQSVVVSGRVQNPFRLAIGSQVVGVVRGVPVREGQSVQANDLLIQLDDSESRAALAQAESAAAMAELQLRRVREVQLPLAEQGVRQSLINLEQAMRMQARHQDLFSQAFIGQAALDESSRTTRLSESQLVGAVHQWHSVRPGGAEHVQAQANLQQAQAGVALARARWSYARLRAPVAGTLIARQVEVGDVVQPGKSLMTLSPSGDTQVVAQIDEKQLKWLNLGQPARVSADAYPQARFPAELVYINPGVDPQRGSVEVKLRVPQPPDYLRQDMTVSVDIQTAHRPQVLQVQESAVQGEAEGGAWVYKLLGPHVHKTAVSTGMRAGGWVEILEGLQAGEVVVNTGGATLTDGQRVRPRASLH